MQRCLLLLALALAISAFAQPELAPFEQPPPQPGRRPGNLLGAGMMLENLNSVNLAILPEGVFVLRNGALAKFTAGTLKPAGVLELFGPAPAPPEAQDGAVLRDWLRQTTERSGAAATLAQDGRLYIVVGGNYFRVNLATLQVETKADLGVPGNNPRPAILAGAPQLKLEGGVLYIVLGQELITVEPDTGKVAARVALPAELFPAMPGPVAGFMPPDAAPFAEGRWNRGERNAW